MIKPPPLRNDCFALPADVDWVPVDQALADLKSRIAAVVGEETCLTEAAQGRILADDITACRSSPPHANTAVDGYGFAGETALGSGPVHLTLIKGRAAAGEPFTGTVPIGHAIRILTGAKLPEGVDTVVLQEDVSTDRTQIAFNGPLKARANTRQAGEDIAEGDIILSKGRRLTSADLALLSSVGVAEVPVFNSLRVGVLSTGDELCQTSDAPEEGQIFDANRPMLLALIAQFGFLPVDLGIVGDDRQLLSDKLDHASQTCDVILTSGGASSGDEDHLSVLLKDTGSMAMWRIAVKPGRPLALGMWQGVPVFGLPGNPVAALTCTLIFARPAMSVLAGGAWQEPQGFLVPAAFEKSKKAGRREFLRARMNDGVVEVFKSEGSGRVSGLSWATGFVELSDEAQTIQTGDLVRYIPFSSFN